MAQITVPAEDTTTGNGIAITVKSGKMTIVVPLDPNPPLSSSGKTRLAYTSRGYLPHGNYRISLNIIADAD